MFSNSIITFNFYENKINIKCSSLILILEQEHFITEKSDSSFRSKMLFFQSLFRRKLFAISGLLIENRKLCSKV